jgi:hypothetical protein
MKSTASLARTERYCLKRKGQISKIKKGQHRFYICNICGNGREYTGGGILLHFSRTHKDEHSRIRNESMEVF